MTTSLRAKPSVPLVPEQIPPRARMTERAAVGSKWRRRRDKTVWEIKQSHRTDRCAELVPADGSRAQAGTSRVYVPFGHLRTRYVEVTA